MRRGALAVAIACSASCGAPGASVHVAPPPPSTAASTSLAITRDCPEDLAVLARTGDGVLVLGRHQHRLVAHADGTIETGMPLPAGVLGVAEIDGRWLFSCWGGTVYAASSYLGDVTPIAHLPSSPRDVLAGVTLQHGALGEVLLTARDADHDDARPVRIDADGTVTPLELPPVEDVLFESAHTAVLVFVGGGLGHLSESGEVAAIALGPGGGDRVASVVLAGGDAVVVGSSGTVSRAPVTEVACDPSGAIASALAASVAAERARTPDRTAGTRDLFFEDDATTLRVVDHASGVVLGRAPYPRPDCSLDVVGDEGVFLTCERDPSDEQPEPPEDLYWLDPALQWSHVGEADEVTLLPGERLLRFDETTRTGVHACFLVGSGRRTCFEGNVRPAIDERRTSEEPVACDTTAYAIHVAHGVASTLRSVDLVTGAEIAAPIPVAIRSGSWSATDELDDGCGAARESPDGTRTRYRMVVAEGAATLVALPDAGPRVIDVSELACCFGGHTLRCDATPRGEPAPLWSERGEDDDVAAVHVGDHRVAIPPTSGSESTFVRALLRLDDGSAYGALWTDEGTRALGVDTLGTLTLGDRAVRVTHGPVAVAGVGIVEVERRDDTTIARVRDRHTGRVVSERTLSSGGPIALREGRVGVMLDDVFVPLDASVPPTRLEPVPNALADFDCRWPPICTGAPAPDATLVLMEGGALVGLDAAAWIGVERDGASACLREVITSYGETLALVGDRFVGTTVRDDQRVDVTCRDERIGEEAP